MLKIEVIKFEAQDVITASTACVCDPADCYGYETENGVTIVHSNNCTEANHDCNPKIERFEQAEAAALRRRFFIFSTVFGINDK